ncbi:MAG: methyltransferase domain-containing protein [Dehalococcoidia bacterium]
MTVPLQATDSNDAPRGPWRPAAGRAGARPIQAWLPPTAAAFLTDTPIFLLPREVNLQAKHRVLVIEAEPRGISRFLAARIPFTAPPVTLAPPISTPAADAGPFRSRPGVLPFPDTAFDLVIAAHAFHRLNDDGLSRLVREAHRVLRPGGVFVGWDFAARSSRAINELHRRALTRGGVRPYLRGFGPLAAYTTEAGFVRIERPQLPPFLFPPIPRTAVLAQKGSGLLRLGDATLR